MKIIFLCGCLEPGRDGVGDYTRLLAAELIRQGHSAAIISLNDSCVSATIVETQKVDNISVEVLRLSSIIQYDEQVDIANIYINKFNPDLLSLQFVIFAYHVKGLPYKLASKINRIGRNRLWHIMFHELWLGMEVNASFKHYIWGQMQQAIIKSFIHSLKPIIIHTHTWLYQQQIQKLGFAVDQLPLFGNIPVDNISSKNRVMFSDKSDDNLNLIIFGNIFINSPVDDFTEEMAAYIKENNKKVSLTFIGRCGSELTRWADKCAKAGMTITILGEQSPKVISETLSKASLGISTYPIALVEKSGSVAAMLEHSLPVLCVYNLWKPRHFRNTALKPNIFNYKKGNLQSILTTKFSLTDNVTLSVVAHQFIQSFSNSI